MAQAHYEALAADAEAGAKSKLAKRLENDRRVELAEFGRTNGQQLSDALFRQATFGVYSRRAKEGSWNEQVLIRQRRIDYNLRFLDKLVVAGADPEVPYPAEQVRAAVNTLAELTLGVTARNIRARAV